MSLFRLVYPNDVDVRTPHGTYCTPCSVAMSVCVEALSPCVQSAHSQPCAKSKMS